MSAYFPQPAPVDSGRRFLRTQTNEAALVRLQQQADSRPDKILALCSDTVRTKPTVPALDGQTKIPTLEYFRSFLAKQGITAELNVIPVPDSMSEADQTNAISAIIENVSADDSIYIDLSGGMRDTAMLMVAVARYLQDVRGAYTRQVLYAELQGTQSVVRDAIRKCASSKACAFSIIGNCICWGSFTVNLGIHPRPCGRKSVSSTNELSSTNF